MRSKTRVLTVTAAAATLAAATVGPATADDITVEPGDTLTGIAARHDALDSWRALYEANADDIDDPALITPGTELTLPGDDEGPATHEVEEGETLAEIARSYDEVPSWRALAAANADVIDDPDRLLVGQVLELTELPASEIGPVPQAEPEPEPQPEPDPQADSAPQEPESAEAQAQADPEPEPEPAAASAGVWDRLAECESNGNWSANTGNGYYGGLQFTLSSWGAVGGSGYPHEASRAEQIRRAEALLDQQGWSAWPACSRQLGLR